MAASARERTLLNFGWKFLRADAAGAELLSFDDKRWQVVDLPHDAAIMGPFQKKNGGSVRNGFRSQGRGWYRRYLAYDAAWAGKRIILSFEGVYRLATVYINVKPVELLERMGMLDLSMTLPTNCSKGTTSSPYIMTIHMQKVPDGTMAKASTEMFGSR